MAHCPFCLWLFSLSGGNGNVLRRGEGTPPYIPWKNYA